MMRSIKVVSYTSWIETKINDFVYLWFYECERCTCTNILFGHSLACYWDYKRSPFIIYIAHTHTHTLHCNNCWLIAKNALLGPEQIERSNAWNMNLSQLARSICICMNLKRVESNPVLIHTHTYTVPALNDYPELLYTVSMISDWNLKQPFVRPY